MDGGAWKATVHGVAKSQTRLSDFTFTFHFHALEKEMATHCSVLPWRIPGMGQPGGLLSMGSHRVGQDWSDLAAAAAVFSVHCYARISFWFGSYYLLVTVPYIFWLQILSVIFVTNTFWFCGFCFTLCNFSKICLCISLAAQGLGCGTQAHCCSLWGLVPWPGMEPGPPALRTPSFCQWTPGKCLECFFLIFLI